MTTPNHYHHGDLRTALLDEALKSLDRDRGLPTWRALARACAVSHTAPYRHFGNIEALQIAVATECFKRLTLAVNASISKVSDPFERLARGLRAYVDFGRKHPSWYELMFKQVKADDEALHTASATAYGTLVRGIAACQIADPEDAAFTLWCAIHGITDLVASDLEPPVTGRRNRARTDDVIAMCVNYVRGMLRKKV